MQNSRSRRSFKFSKSSRAWHRSRSSRADKLNALTFGIYNELADTFAALDSVNDVRAIMITGEGRAFCSGGDVEDIIGELFARDMKGLVEFTRNHRKAHRQHPQSPQTRRRSSERNCGRRGSSHRARV